jgi:hypothetical protein
MNHDDIAPREAELFEVGNEIGSGEKHLRLTRE